MSRKVTAGPGDPLYRFGPFIADPVVGRLYHGDEDVPLTPKSFAVLMVLVRSQGQLVVYDEIFKQVWPDTFVEPNNLARNISMLRKALHEHDAAQEYIVTVTGRGYRLIVPASEISRMAFAERARHTFARDEEVDQILSTPPDAVEEVHALEASAASDRRPVRPAVHGRWVAAAVAVAAIALAAVYLSSLAPKGDAPPERRLWALTSGAGLATDPAWSPDGAFVAYSSDRNGSFNLWVQPSSGGSPIQRTFGAGPHWQPSWSPSGRHIAFRSERDGGGIDIVDALGGSEWRLVDFGFWPQWSPDGRRILFNDAGDSFVVGLDDKAPRRATEPVSPALSRLYGSAWHPDGSRISVLGSTPSQGRVFWTISLDGQHSPVRSDIAPAVAEKLRETGLRLGRFLWSRRGDALYFEGQLGDVRNLWRVQVDPATLTWTAGPDRLTTGATNDHGLALSPDGTRLAFGSRIERTTAWSFPFDAEHGTLTGPGEAVTPAGVSPDNLDVSPDGTRVAYSVSGRARHELHIWSLDGKTDRLRTVEDGAIIHPRWSRDSSQLSYVRVPAGQESAPEIVILSANDDRERRVLPTTKSAELVYDWLGNGQSLLTRCKTDAGYTALCLMSPSREQGRTDEMRVIAADPRRDLFSARYSPDERWISFIALSDLMRATVFVIPAQGGPWIRMGEVEERYLEDKPRWAPDGRALYYLSNRDGFWNLWGRRFDPVAGRALGEPFQVSNLRSSPQVMPLLPGTISRAQIGVTRDRVILPVAQTSGAIWVLEDVNR
jgi:Tol biopolymer transport system component/DNA-binding winged helix-turn-helix (wHTH) protein